MGASRSALGVLWGASGAPKGASGMSRGGSWELQGRPLMRLGMLRASLGEALGSFWELRGRIGSKNAETMEFLVVPRFLYVFRGPGLSKIDEKAVQEAAKAARRPLSEAGRPLAEHVGS